MSELGKTVLDFAGPPVRRDAVDCELLGLLIKYTDMIKVSWHRQKQWDEHNALIKRLRKGVQQNEYLVPGFNDPFGN